MTDQAVSISWRETPFSGQLHHEIAPPGSTIADIIQPLRNLPRGFAEGVGEARLNGDLIPRELWPRVKPKPGTGLTLYTPLRSGGGGGGAGGKNTAALIAVISVLLVATAVSGGLLGAYGIGTTGLLGTLFTGGNIGASIAGASIGIGGTLRIGAKL